MGYADGKAAGRVMPGKDRVHTAPAPASVSNQEKTQGQDAKYHTYSHAPASGVEVGNLIKLDAAGKGLNVAGRPSTIAVAGRDKDLPAVENPSGSRSIPGKY